MSLSEKYRENVEKEEERMKLLKEKISDWFTKLHNQFEKFESYSLWEQKINNINIKLANGSLESEYMLLYYTENSRSIDEYPRPEGINFRDFNGILNHERYARYFNCEKNHKLNQTCITLENSKEYVIRVKLYLCMS